MSFSNLLHVLLITALQLNLFNYSLIAGNNYTKEFPEAQTSVVDSLFALSSSNIGINNEIALLYAEKGKELLNAIEYEQGEGEQKYLLIKAQIAYYDDRYKDALFYLDSLGRMLALDIVTPDLGRYYSLKALVNFYLGYQELSIEMYLKAISVYQKLSDYSGLSVCQNSIGKLFLNKGDYESADRYFNLALETNKKTSDKNTFGAILINKGSLKMQLDSFEVANQFFSKAYNLFLELGDLRRIALSLFNIAEVQSKIGSYADAIEKLNESLNIYRKLDEKYGQAMVLIRISIIYRESENYDLSKKFGEEALSLSIQINNLTLQTDAFLQLSKAYKAGGDYLKALELFESYHAHKTELESKSSASRIAEIEFKAQLTANEKDILLLNQRNHTRTLQVYILIVFTGIGLLFTIGLFQFLRLKNKNLHQKKEILEKKNHFIDLENKVYERDKKMLENDLELKNKELASRALALVQLNETLKNVGYKMSEIQSGSNMEKRQIKSLLQEIQNATHYNIWEEFDLAFSNVHNQFYEKLFKICPTLTAAEIKIAALLKLNLSTKEIAAISFKSESSIKTTRHRLRQKLNLAESDNLIPFLMKL